MPSEDYRELPIVGREVVSACYDLDWSGYPFVRIVFSDGSVLTVIETGQCGSIAVDYNLRG